MKIGIIQDSLQTNSLNLEIIKYLSKKKNLTLYLLLNEHKNFSQNNFKKVAKKGIIRSFEIFFFNILNKIEWKLLSYFNKNISNYKKRYILDKSIFKNCIKLEPIIKNNNIYRYNNYDIKKIKSLKLDLILRGQGGGIYKGDILNSSKDGIISFHHGDNRWNRGGPPGFWEVYLKKAASGFIIQKLNNELDNGLVLFRGELKTQNSHVLNLVNLYISSIPYMKIIIDNYLTKKELKEINYKTNINAKILKSPNFFQSITYIKRIIIYLFTILIKRKILKRSPRWSIAIKKTFGSKLIFENSMIINNQPNRFFADPFIIKKDEKTIIFAEDYDYIKRRGVISAIDIDLENKKTKFIFEDILKENFHHSFPFIFENDNDLYMIPETYDKKSIRLYKCVQFPKKWVFVHDMISNIKAVDTIIFNNKKIWWILTNVNLSDSEKCPPALFAFSSSDLFSQKWKPHKNNPIVFNVDNGRNGGLVKIRDEVFRVRQSHGFNLYGKSISLAKIKMINEKHYHEEEYAKYDFKEYSKIIGVHHLSNHKNLFTFDICKEEFIK